MSRVVWTYPLAPIVTLTMPIGAHVVAVGRDPNGDPCLWAEVDELALQRGRRFAVVGTGMRIPEAARHIGTIFATDLHPYIWHVYEFAT